MSHFSSGPPPQQGNPHIMLNDDYSDEEDSSEADLEFSMSNRSRTPSSAGPPPLSSNQLKPFASDVHHSQQQTPPPPISHLPTTTDDDDTGFMSLDELDRLQSQRKNTVNTPIGSSDAFRSTLRQSFSTTSRPLLPPTTTGNDSFNYPPPPPLSTNGSMANLHIPQPPHPIVTATLQHNNNSNNTSRLSQPPAQPPVQYGVTINNDLVPYKVPTDNTMYSQSLTHNGIVYPCTSDTIPKSPLLVYNPQGKDVLQFQQVITSVEEAIRQAKAGQFAVKRCVKFIEQWCQHELRHVDAETTLVNLEASKSGHSNYGTTLSPEVITQEKMYKLYIGLPTSRSEQYDEMHRTQRAMISIFNCIEKEIALRRKRVAGSIKLKDELATQASLLDFRIRKCYEDYKSFTAEKVKEVSHVRKLEKECQSLLKQAKLSMGLDKEEDDDRPKQDEKKGFKIFGKLQHMKDKAKVSLAGGPKEFCAELATLSEQYLAAIEKGNLAISTYQARCTKLLGTLALVEAERLVLMNFTLSQFAKLAFLAQQPIQLLYHGLLFNTFEMDPQYDFQEYLRRQRTAGSIRQEDFEVYRLPVTPEDIRAMRLDVNPNSVFKVSLQQCMRIQFKEFPTLKTPRIVGVLIDSMKRLGGITSEGIFRISHQRDELQSLRKQFESGNYIIPTSINSPHAPAALLKEWLRELQESLIPTESYQMWMNVAKNLTTNGPGPANLPPQASNQPSSPGLTPVSPHANAISKSTFAIDQNTDAQLLNLYSTLDEYNQNVIRDIATLCVEISHPYNQRVNRMTIENLAIVFAPSFFRNPSDDPNDILQNSKNETKMTALLLATIGTKYFDCFDLDNQYYQLPPSQQLGGNLLQNNNNNNNPMSPSPNQSGILSPMPPPPSTPSHNSQPSSFFSPSKPSQQNQQLFHSNPTISTTASPPQQQSTRDLYAQSIPENSPTSNHFSTPTSSSGPSSGHFGQHPSTPQAPQAPQAPPSSPYGTNTGYGQPQPPMTPTSTNSFNAPPLPPRRGTFVLPQNQVLPPGPVQRNPSTSQSQQSQQSHFQ